MPVCLSSGLSFWNERRPRFVLSEVSCPVQPRLPGFVFFLTTFLFYNFIFLFYMLSFSEDVSAAISCFLFPLSTLPASSFAFAFFRACMLPEDELLCNALSSLSHPAAPLCFAGSRTVLIHYIGTISALLFFPQMPQACTVRGSSQPRAFCCDRRLSTNTHPYPISSPLGGNERQRDNTPPSCCVTERLLAEEICTS